MILDVSFPEPFEPLLDDNVRKVVEPSGRSSGKTTTNENLIIKVTMESKYNNVWYCRAEKSDIRSSIYNSMLSTIQQQGLAMFYRASLNPMEITCTRTGAKIYFDGINGKTRDDLTATKGFTPQFKTLALFILDEANEVKYSTHVQAAETTANKFLLPHGKIIYAYNPPPNRTHWSHLFFGNMINNGAVKIYSTWEDIYELLKPATIQEILEMQKNDPRHYQYWYLGQMVSLEGLVLYTFRKDRNTMSLERFKQLANFNGYQPLYVIYGVDSGVVKDATAVCAWAVMPDATLLKLSTFYYEPRKNGDEPLPNSQQVNLIYDWYNKLYRQMAEMGVILPSPANECWVFDSAVVTQDLMFEWQRKTMFYCKAVEKKNIERDIKRLQNGYFNGFLKILDWEENKPSFDEIETFAYDEENKIPEGQADHTIDADKYATAHYYYEYIGGLG